MKIARILIRDIRDSFRNVFRNFSLSIASISCITITLIVVAISLILSVNVNKFTTLVKEDVTIVVFLDKDITLDELKVVESKIKNLDNVDKDKVVIKDKEQIRKEFMEVKSYEVIMKDWEKRDDNKLRDTIDVKVINLENIKETADAIEKIEHVYTAKYGEGMVEQLVDIFDIIKKASYIAVIALIIVTAFLISNTIKITIFSRNREISIMRLVGASNINIKIPFVFEGLILGAIGSIIPIAVVTYGYQVFYDKFHGKLFTNIIELEKPNPFIYKSALLLLLIGIVVGAIGSLRAVRKYLKV